MSGMRCLLAGALFGAMLAACTEKADTGLPRHGYTHAEGPFDFEVALGAAENQTQTRAADFDDLSIANISEVWVGLFDTEDHHIIGFGSVENRNSTALTQNVSIENLFFDDGHPDAHVAAVVNYAGVEARLGDGEKKPLLDVLKYDVGSLEDFCNVAVDVVSAENAVNAGRGNHVVMSGFFTTSTANFVVTPTLDEDGTLKSFATPANIGKITMLIYTESTAFEYQISFSNNLGYNQNSNYIYLRPMFSHLEVNVNLNAGAIDRNGGVEWKLCNVPRYVYLIEHATIEDCTPYTAETWAAVTPAASDLYDDGYYTMTGFTSDTTKEADAPYDIIGEPVTGGNGTYSFGFWHYENKHWGLASATNYAQREATFAGTDIFSSLCPSVDRTFNNNATYMVIRTTGTDGSNYDFRVHEGFATNSTNSSDTASARDFSTFRNVDYAYTITINGVGSALSPMSTRGAGSDIEVEVEAAR